MSKKTIHDYIYQSSQRSHIEEKFHFYVKSSVRDSYIFMQNSYKIYPRLSEERMFDYMIFDKKDLKTYLATYSANLKDMEDYINHREKTYAEQEIRNYLYEVAKDILLAKAVFIKRKGQIVLKTIDKEQVMNTSDAGAVLNIAQFIARAKSAKENVDKMKKIKDQLQFNETQKKSKIDTVKNIKNLECDTEVDYLKAENYVKENIFGHDRHISEIFKKIKRKAMNLSTDKRSPVSLFLAGPTGCGKTEICLKVAESVGLPIVRIDMSEYMEKHNVARLIGAPPGYIGHGSGAGVLKECDGAPCVIILDEFEKAHHDVQNIFLQVLDYGVMTSGENKQIDLTKSVIMFTSNIGARDATENKAGFVAKQSSSDQLATIHNEIKRVLSPEFLNRLSSVMIFEELSYESKVNILKKRIEDINTAVFEKYGVVFKIDDSAFDKLMKDSVCKGMGIRSMHRAIETHVLEPFSEIAFKIGNGDTSWLVNNWSNEVGEGKVVLAFLTEELPIAS